MSSEPKRAGIPSDFGSPELREINVYCLSHPACGIFVKAIQKKMCLLITKSLLGHQYDDSEPLTNVFVNCPQGKDILAS